MAKFKVGDKVVVEGHGDGEIVEVAEHDTHWLETHTQRYGVRLEPWEKVVIRDIVHYKGPNGELRDHECDTLGAVQETSLKAAGHHHAEVRTGRPGKS